jgi:DNA-binding transcriptional ArsR family regulator
VSRTGEDLEQAGDLFKVLASPLRLGILAELAKDPRCVHELVEALRASQPLVSQHLRVLRGARLVRGTRRGREVAYELTDEHVAHIVLDALTHVREAQEAQP